MKNVTKLIYVLIAAIFMGASAIALAAEQGTDSGAVVLSDSLHASATVVKINKKKRELTLKNEHGETMVVVAGKEVRNFKQIKKGDVIELDYHIAAASALKKIGDTDVATQATVAERAPAGGKPGAAVMHTRMGSAEVLDIDMNSRVLTVKGQRGNVAVIKVPAEMKAFDSLKKGDKIAVEYTEAMAISVKTPPKKKK
jgi:hypothetical protein